MEDALVDGQEGARRDDVDMVSLKRQSVASLQHGHSRVPSKQLSQHAGVIGFEVLYHHKDKATCRRDVFEELLQRFEPAGRCPQTNDQGGSRPALGRSPVRRIFSWLTTHECTSNRPVEQRASINAIIAGSTGCGMVFTGVSATWPGLNACSNHLGPVDSGRSWGPFPDGCCLTRDGLFVRPLFRRESCGAAPRK
jgi:hypothetical protein